MTSESSSFQAVANAFNVREIFENRWVGDWLSVHQLRGHYEHIFGLFIHSRNPDGSIWICRSGNGEAGKRIEECLRFVDGVEDCSTPKLALRKDFEIKTGDDAKIVSSSSKSPEEIRVGFVSHIFDTAIREDDLVVDAC